MLLFGSATAFIYPLTYGHLHFFPVFSDYKENFNDMCEHIFFYLGQISKSQMTGSSDVNI